MNLPVSTQLAQTAAALAVGASLGLYYDILRVIRQKSGRYFVTLILDTVFWIGAVLALFALGLGPGLGELRMFMVCAVGLGGLIYFLGMSKLVIWVLSGSFDISAKILRFILQPLKRIIELIKKALKKLSEKVKKPFQKSRKWFTITAKRNLPVNSVPGNSTEVLQYASQKGRYTY